MPKPLLLLDIDGAICPLGEGSSEELLDVVLGNGFWVRYSSETPQRLLELGREFQLVWATAWEAQANDLLAPVLGLAPLPYISFDEEARPGESWKLSAIRRYVRDRPLAWVDDDIGRESHEWAADRSAPTLLVEVSPDCGIGAADVRRLLDFAADVRGDKR